MLICLTYQEPTISLPWQTNENFIANYKIWYLDNSKYLKFNNNKHVNNSTKDSTSKNSC